jgi:glycosyltransferase involved in cell wall biosynthesis
MSIPVFVIPHLLQPVSPLADFLALREIVSLLRRERPDVLHTHTAKAGFLGRMAASRLNIPSIYTPHGWAFTKQFSPVTRSLFVRLERGAARHTAFIVAVSRSDKEEALAQSIAPPERIVVIPNGIRDTPHRANPDTRRIPRLVMAARFAPPKDPLLLIRTLSRMVRKFELLFIGDGPLRREAQALTMKLGLTDRVRFLGVRADVEHILAQCDIAVLTSNWESFGLSILEGMRAGLPVVATAVGGARELVTDGVTGFLVPPSREDRLYESLDRLIASPELRIRIGQAARKSFESTFSLDDMLEQTFTLYKTAANRERTRLSAPIETAERLRTDNGTQKT